jgi:hypothetical protein
MATQIKKDTGIVSIHGKEYQTVAYRVGKFRECHNFDLSIQTELISVEGDYVIMKAVISNPEGFIVATGHAEEKRNSTNINKTSALENCETSAIGRALASLGMGGTEFASADEVANAMVQQKLNQTYVNPHEDKSKKNEKVKDEFKQRLIEAKDIKELDTAMKECEAKFNTWPDAWIDGMNALFVKREKELSK